MLIFIVCTFNLAIYGQDDANVPKPLELVIAAMVKKIAYSLVMVCAFGFTSPNFAAAQMILPGARPPVLQGEEAPPAQSQPRPQFKKKAPVVANVLKAPDIKNVLGGNLQLNGKSGKLILSEVNGAVNIQTLILRGSKISNPDQFCQVTVISGTPILATPAAELKGVAHYSVEVPACLFEFDVLDGALLVLPRVHSCKLVAADCAVDPSGLWGPPASSQGPQQAKANEAARSHAESEMREQFRTLMKRVNGRANLEALATDQAGFSSFRTTICRNYALDSVQDFCALKLTQARAIQLNALVRAAPAKLASKKTRQKIRPRAKRNLN